MSNEQALLRHVPEAGELLPVGPAILTGQLPPSSIAQYRRDMAAYLCHTQFW